MRTEKQVERQRFRDAGRYSKVNPCQLCGKSAGVDYWSDRRTDTVDACGNRWNDVAIALCEACAAKLDKMPDGEAYAYASSHQQES
jgi:hypothetical protein